MIGRDIIVEALEDRLDAVNNGTADGDAGLIERLIARYESKDSIMCWEVVEVLVEISEEGDRPNEVAPDNPLRYKEKQMLVRLKCSSEGTKKLYEEQNSNPAMPRSLEVGDELIAPALRENLRIKEAEDD